MLQFGVFWLNKIMLPVGTVCVSVPILWGVVCVYYCFDIVLGMVALRVRLLKDNCYFCVGCVFGYTVLLCVCGLYFFLRYMVHNLLSHKTIIEQS